MGKAVKGIDLGLGKIISLILNKQILILKCLLDIQVKGGNQIYELEKHLGHHQSM